MPGRRHPLRSSEKVQSSLMVEHLRVHESSQKRSAGRSIAVSTQRWDFRDGSACGVNGGSLEGVEDVLSQKENLSPD